ncbi:MAG: hypothetical protein JST51_14630 [Armatimonadetes bacterium]|nr:hypothetical protein [Armatimonadota bacterium]
MKGRWKWVFLSIGVLLISATCGFGYEQQATRSQYEVAKDAFKHRDWDRLVENLTYKNYPRSPSKPALAQFLRTYVEPVLDRREFDLVSRKWESSMVPIPNEEVAYQPTWGRRRFNFLQLDYTDDVAWFQMPVEGRRFGIFQGKQVVLSFYVTFYRVAYAEYPPMRSDVTSSVLRFVEDQKDRLTQMGITPYHLYSPAKTWDEYIADNRKLLEEVRAKAEKSGS